jgi:hypothetical protein
MRSGVAMRAPVRYRTDITTLVTYKRVVARATRRKVRHTLADRVSQSGGDMSTRTIVLTALLGLFATSACLAADANLGTWKLNEAKSTIPAGATKNNTVVYTAAGADVKVTVDGVSGDGKATHNEWTGKFDGKDYPVTGDATQDARAYRKIDANTMELDVKKGGKVLLTGRIVLSADGKSRTVTLSGTDAAGKKISTNATYDKQ